ncbi:MAG: hypothetical protein U1D55_16675 [Phycisphaerae bacterium]
MNALAIYGSVVISGLGLMFGVFLCVYSHGNAAAGIVFVSSFGLLGCASLMHSRDAWGWQRRHYQVAEEVQHAHAAHQRQAQDRGRKYKAALARRDVGGSTASRDAA